MVQILAICGSPRRMGNTSLLLERAVEGARASAHTKILMDRCQSFWVKKYWIDKTLFGASEARRKGLFISVGTTRGKRLFQGVRLSVRYFFETFDAELWKALLYRGPDFEGDVLKHPEYLEEAYESGKDLVRAIRSMP